MCIDGGRWARGPVVEGHRLVVPREPRQLGGDVRRGRGPTVVRGRVHVVKTVAKWLVGRGGEAAQSSAAVGGPPAHLVSSAAAASDSSSALNSSLSLSAAAVSKNSTPTCWESRHWRIFARERPPEAPAEELVAVSLAGGGELLRVASPAGKTR